MTCTCLTNQNDAEKAMKSLIRQDSYEENVQASIQLVHTRSLEFRRAADAFSQSVGIKTLEMTDQNLALGSMNYAKSDEIYKQGEATQEEVKALSASIAKNSTCSILEDQANALRSLVTGAECTSQTMISSDGL